MRKKQKRLWRLASVLVIALGLSAAVHFDLFSKPQQQNLPAFEEHLLSEIDTAQYETVIQSENSLHCGDLILVNSSYPYAFNDHDGLVSVFDFKNKSYKVKDKEVLLCQSIMEDLNHMLTDFEAEEKVSDVIVISGYRTYAKQQEILNDRSEKLGAREASLLVAPAGASEHHTGLALDFGIYTDSGRSYSYEGTGKYQRLNDNAFQYGFVVRYTAEKMGITGVTDEPWHFRYVGRPHAYLMAQNDFCLEEYIDFLRAYEFSKQHLIAKDYNGQEYEIYFVRAGEGQTEVPVPKEGKYIISGNNVDGFIVTAEKR